MAVSPGPINLEAALHTSIRWKLGSEHSDATVGRVSYLEDLQTLELEAKPRGQSGNRYALRQRPAFVGRRRLSPPVSACPVPPCYTDPVEHGPWRI